MDMHVLYYLIFCFFFYQQKEYDLVMDDEVAFVLAETVAGSKGENEVCGSRDDESISVLYLFVGRNA